MHQNWIGLCGYFVSTVCLEPMHQIWKDLCGYFVAYQWALLGPTGACLWWSLEISLNLFCLGHSSLLMLNFPSNNWFEPWARRKTGVCSDRPKCSSHLCFISMLKSLPQLKLKHHSCNKRCMKKHVLKFHVEDDVCLYRYWQNLPAWAFNPYPNRRTNLSLLRSQALGNDSWWPPCLLQIETSLCVTLKRKKKRKECWVHLIETFKRLIDRFRLNVTGERKNEKGSQIVCEGILLETFVFSCNSLKYGLRP